LLLIKFILNTGIHILQCLPIVTVYTVRVYLYNTLWQDTLLQEADNRMHSDSIQCYKRQTIEYTLTVYNVTRGRQENTLWQYTLIQEVDNRIHSDSIIFYRVYSIVCLLYQCILSECILLSASCNSVYCESAFYYLPLVTVYTIKVYSIVCFL
jgi:hypothetical protein